MDNQKREWIVQRCVSAAENDCWCGWLTRGSHFHYQDWPEYSKRLMTRDEMKTALAECSRKWPDFEFRGHNVVNQKAGYGESLRSVC